MRDAQHEARKLWQQSRVHQDHTISEAAAIYTRSRELQYIIGEGFESPGTVARVSQYEGSESPRSQDFSD